MLVESRNFYCCGLLLLPGGVMSCYRGNHSSDEFGGNFFIQRKCCMDGSLSFPEELIHNLLHVDEWSHCASSNHDTDHP